jgi:hypothetical protein
MRRVTDGIDLNDTLLNTVFESLTNPANKYFKNYLSTAPSASPVYVDMTRENFIPESQVADVVVTRENVPTEELPTTEDLAKGESVTKLTFGQPTVRPVEEVKPAADTFADDMNEFNNLVSMTNGVKPTTFDVQARHWVLNNRGYYDLVDKTTGEIYLRDIDMQTGLQVYKPNMTPVDEARRVNAIKYLNDNYKLLDTVFAEKGYDIKDIISKLESLSTQEELNDIITNILKKLC